MNTYKAKKLISNQYIPLFLNDNSLKKLFKSKPKTPIELANKINLTIFLSFSLKPAYKNVANIKLKTAIIRS